MRTALILISMSLCLTACGRHPAMTADGGIVGCGGLIAHPCPTGDTCEDDPKGTCHLATDPDCAGVCYAK